MSSRTARAIKQQYQKTKQNTAKRNKAKQKQKIETVSYVVLGCPEAFCVAEARFVIPSASTSPVLGL